MTGQTRRVPLAGVKVFIEREGIESGEITEVFACGTAAIVTPVGRMGGDDFEMTVGDGNPGPVTLVVRQRLTDIQYGRAEDAFGWMQRVA